MAWHPFRNLGWKFLALLMGTALWFTVSGDLAIERTIDDRPVIMKNTGTGVQAIVMPSRVTMDMTIGRRMPEVRKYGSNMKARPGPQVAV